MSNKLFSTSDKGLFKNVCYVIDPLQGFRFVTSVDKLKKLEFYFNFVTKSNSYPKSINFTFSCKSSYRTNITLTNFFKNNKFIHGCYKSIRFPHINMDFYYSLQPLYDDKLKKDVVRINFSIFIDNQNDNNIIYLYRSTY